MQEASKLVKLISFWSSAFLSKYGDVEAQPWMISRLRDLLYSVHDIYPDSSELNWLVDQLADGEQIGIAHDLNRAFLRFTIEHHGDIPATFIENIRNIINHLNNSRVGNPPPQC